MHNKKKYVRNNSYFMDYGVEVEHYIVLGIATNHFQLMLTNDK